MARGTKGGCHHVAHDVAIVVLAGPDHSTAGTDDTGDNIVDESIEIFNPARFIPRFIFLVIDFLENVLEAMIIDFRDRVLRGKPEVFLDR